MIDPDMRQERTVVHPNDGTIASASSFGVPVINPLTLGALNPLPVGNHTVKTYWRFRAMHCDGFADGLWPADPGGGCIAAGETQLPTMAFEVTPGHW